MRHLSDFAAFDPHPAFRFHRGLHRSRRRIRLRLPIEPRRELCNHNDVEEPINPEPR